MHRWNNLWCNDPFVILWRSAELTLEKTNKEFRVYFDQLLYTSEVLFSDRTYECSYAHSVRFCVTWSDIHLEYPLKDVRLVAALIERDLLKPQGVEEIAMKKVERKQLRDYYFSVLRAPWLKFLFPWGRRIRLGLENWISSNKTVTKVLLKGDIW